jgi:hypothetical protein
MSIVKKLILVVVILLFSFVLYRLFERRQILQKNMENNVVSEGFSVVNAANPDYSYIKSQVASLAIDSRQFPSKAQNYLSDKTLALCQLCVKSSWNSAYSGGYVSDIMVQYVLSRGCRFLDFAVYLNSNGQAVIGYSSDPTVPNPSIKNTKDITLSSMLESTLINAFGNQSGQTYPVTNTSDPLFINIRPRPFLYSDTKVNPSPNALTNLTSLYAAIDGAIQYVKNEPNFSRYFTEGKKAPDSHLYTRNEVIIIKENNSYADQHGMNFFHNMTSDGTISQRFYTQTNSDHYTTNPPRVNGNQTVTKHTVDLIVPNTNTSSQSNPNVYSTISNYGINFNALQYYNPDANLYECEKMFQTYGGGIVPMAYCLNYINNNATPRDLEQTGLLTMWPSWF